jgi:hypothetical protein
MYPSGNHKWNADEADSGGLTLIFFRSVRDDPPHPRSIMAGSECVYSVGRFV